MGNKPQCVSTPTTIILPTTESTIHSLNCFSYVMYVLQTRMHSQNIAKLLTHPCKMSPNKYYPYKNLPLSILVILIPYGWDCWLFLTSTKGQFSSLGKCQEIECWFFNPILIKKRKTKFNQEWTKEFRFLSKSRKNDFHVFCTECCCNVEIGSKGKSAVYWHIITDNEKSSPFPTQVFLFGYQCPLLGKFVNDNPSCI